MGSKMKSILHSFVTSAMKFGVEVCSVVHPHNNTDHEWTARTELRAFTNIWCQQVLVVVDWHSGRYAGLCDSGSWSGVNRPMAIIQQTDARAFTL